MYNPLLLQQQAMLNMQRASSGQLLGAAAGAGSRGPSPVPGTGAPPAAALVAVPPAVRQMPPAQPGQAPPASLNVMCVVPGAGGALQPAIYPLPQAFLAAHPAEWPTWQANANNYQVGQQAVVRYQAWTQQQQQQWASAVPPRPPSAAPAAKRVKLEGGGSAAPAPAPAAPALTLAQQAAASQARLVALAAERARAAAAATVPTHPIIKPRDEEDRSFQPAPRLAGLVREACGPGARLGSDTLGDAGAALKMAAAEFVGGAAAFAAAMAKRRGSEAVEPADLLLYFERAWNIQIPGYSEGEVRPYRRPKVSETHRQRMAAVRSGAVAEEALEGGGGAPAANGVAGGGPKPKAGGGKAAPAGAGAKRKQQQQGDAGSMSALSGGCRLAAAPTGARAARARRAGAPRDATEDEIMQSIDQGPHRASSAFMDMRNAQESYSEIPRHSFSSVEVEEAEGSEEDAPHKAPEAGWGRASPGPQATADTADDPAHAPESGDRGD
eukprot:scaffold17.g527.t1